jgi:predicted nucleic acid-binding protein
VTLHRPDHADLIRASQLHRRYKISWWDALMVNSALELGCGILWTEDLRHGQRIGSLTVRNPFR